MVTLHVFISTGRFRTLEEMRNYIDETYTEDGDGIPSEFIEEVELDEYEPGCIEAFPSETGKPVPLAQLVAGASWSDQWLKNFDGTAMADAAICVFSPNVVENPSNCSLQYLGTCDFMPT